MEVHEGIVLLILFLPISQISAEQHLKSALDSYVETFLEEHRIPGASIALVHENRTVYLKAWGITGESKEIVITETPYMVNKTNFIETIANAVHTGMIDGISDLRDESDREGMRIVVEIQRDADANLVLRQLYTRTQLQSTFGVINLAVLDGETKEFSLKEMIHVFLDHLIKVSL